jgi:GNAT superfamily N-acetyltransferase
MTLKISTAQESDIDILYQLTSALAEFEGNKISLTQEKLRKYGFGVNKIFEAVIARKDEKPVGMAVYFFVWVGFAGAPALYGEDLFVLPEYRGQGIGIKIIQELARIATERECCQMRWVVYDWNEKAIGFYKKMGAIVRQDLLQVRLDVASFSNLVKR